MHQEELAHKLRLLGKSVPKEYRDKLTRTENALAEQKVKVESLLHRNDVPKEAKKYIEKAINSGVYDKNVEVTDKKYEQKVSEVLDAKVKQFTRNTGLDPKVELSKFMKSRQ